ncbi:MAG: glycoside hydrolase family 127 protein [Candidatus Latescibacteria bacterium]|jgi:hypothetical protein|nr:glycoside hydrolase family 127 protein [Candidatus Latescibacterota bacterium]
MKESPNLDRASESQYAFDGWLGQYLQSVTDQWIKVVPTSNPGMLEMLRDRDRRPYRDLVPFAGEFAGKYLTGAVEVLRLTGDEGLRAVLADFVTDLISCQDKDGYLGPWPRDFRLAGLAPNSSRGGGSGILGVTGLPESRTEGGTDGCSGTWDSWGHYHVMMGLMLWARLVDDRKALRVAKRIADLFCSRFLGTDERMVDAGSKIETNLSPAHALCLLYEKTGTRRYLQLVEQIVREFEIRGRGGELAGDYLRTALAGMEFYQTPKPRWESLHTLMALPELYYITGDPCYRKAFEHIYWSIVKLDRHNNGGFSSAERARGNPYLKLPIETCCTIAWIAMSVEMLRLTGNSIVADEIELSTLNSVMGMHSASGRWVTYDTPMDGVRRASAHSIVCHSREGTPELNCCSVNGHRGLGMVGDWALMHQGDSGITLNYYGPSTMAARLSSGRRVEFSQDTTYPVDGHVKLSVHPSRPTRFRLNLRIPYWSARTRLHVNGEPIENVTSGSYCALEREWRQGDRVEIRLDMSEHYWVGRKQCRGRVSMYRGPILMTYDRRFNDVDPDDLPELDGRSLKRRRLKWSGRIKPIMLLEYRDGNGSKLRLCDFGSAGEGGTPYRSWLKIGGIPKASFSRSNPLRSVRV